MKKITIELPMLYADHHVLEVRRLMLELAGVKDVYASSAFRTLEVSYDEDKTSEQHIRERLDKGGYTGELAVSVENSATGQDTLFFRKSAEIEQISNSVAFVQEVSFQGRPLWPCPGLDRPDAHENGS